jgi:hypothetical protein
VLNNDRCIAFKGLAFDNLEAIHALEPSKFIINTEACTLTGLVQDWKVATLYMVDIIGVSGVLPARAPIVCVRMMIVFAKERGEHDNARNVLHFALRSLAF